jgi:hypothetical protein
VTTLDYCCILRCTPSTTTPVLPNTSYNHFARTSRKHMSRVRTRGADHIENTASSTVAKACLPRHCLATDVLLFRVRILRECVQRPAAGGSFGFVAICVLQLEGKSMLCEQLVRLPITAVCFLEMSVSASKNIQHHIQRAIIYTIISTRISKLLSTCTSFLQ